MTRISILFISCSVLILYSFETCAQVHDYEFADYNFAQNIDDLGVDGHFEEVLLFPDSGVRLIDAQSNVSYNNYLSVGFSIDFLSQWWNGLDRNEINRVPIHPSFDSCIIDTFYIPYKYQRFDTIPDTLILNLFDEVGINLMDTTYQTDIATFATLNYDHQLKRSVFHRAEVKIVLNDKDTAISDYQLLVVPTDTLWEKFPGNHRFAITATFVPGRSYAADDTLLSELGMVQNQLNQFSIRIYKHKDFLGDPDYYNTSLAVDKFMFHSGISKKVDNRFKNWESRYFPQEFMSRTYGDPWKWEVIFSPDCSVPLGNIEEFKLKSIEIFPNPTSGLLVMKLSEESIAKEYVLKVHNNLGGEIFRQKIYFDQSEVKVDLSHLNPGTYYYVIQNSDFISDSGSLIIAK